MKRFLALLLLVTVFSSLAQDVTPLRRKSTSAITLPALTDLIQISESSQFDSFATPVSITNWVDTSGYSHNFTHPAAQGPGGISGSDSAPTNDPTFLLNGHQTLRFAGGGSGTVLSGGTPWMANYVNTNTGVEVVTVFCASNGAVGNVLWNYMNTNRANTGSPTFADWDPPQSLADGSINENFAYSPTTYWGFGGNLTFTMNTVGAPSIANWTAYDVAVTTNNYLAWLNGFQAGLPSKPWYFMTNSPAPHSIGGAIVYGFGGAFSYYSGHMAAVYIWKRTLNGFEQAQLATYINNKWGINFTYPSPLLANGVTLFGNNATMTVPSTLSSGTAFQWKKNGSPIAGATQSSYTIVGAQASDFADYNVIVNGLSTSTNVFAVVTTQVVSNWVAVLPSAVSSNTVWAVDQFWNGCVTDGFSSKLYSVNCFVPDSLAAACTPLLQPTGVPYSWVNHNFVSGDLTVDGLIGNGSNKYLDTQVNDTSTFSSVNDVGFTFYDMTGTSDTSLNGIITADDNNGYLMVANRSGNSQFYAYGPANGGTGDIHAASPGAGYYCGTRTSSSALALYFANSTHAHASIATGSVAPAYAAQNRTVYMFGCNNGGSVLVPTAHRFSYTSISKGMLSTDSSNQYNRVRTLRLALGGGSL